ncbi:odorant receptor 94a-like [Melanaphis sacchari]|uniref:odorant receptor 94a-like n=1 Tax=Melanaphis sacchari TaxID=742174 RepID=UPI000DC158F3|nr:odorant receptor 94a-like [Melanaphis sacchari]
MDHYKPLERNMELPVDHVVRIYTSFDFRMRHILDHWRERSIRFSTLLSIMYLFTPAILMGITQIYNYTVDKKRKTSNDHDLIYNELKTTIVDHQEVMKKYEVFLALFRKAMLIQIFVSSLGLIIIWVILIMVLSGVEGFETTEQTIIKMICLIPTFSFQIYMVCYLFGSLHDQKDSIIFSLYSSNWTEMDMKCKQLILLTMRVNNANFKKLKFTTIKIINLEFFFKTMSNCYSIISVLIKQIKAKNEQTF